MVLSRHKYEIDEPLRHKRYVNIKVEMTPLQRKYYRKILSPYLYPTDKSVPSDITTDRLGVIINMLLKVLNHPKLLLNGENVVGIEPNGKMSAVKQHFSFII